MQLHFSLSMDKTLYKEKRENGQSKHEITLTKIKGYFLSVGYLDKLKIDPCEIVSLRFFSSALNISLRLVSYIPARITNFENIWVVKISWPLTIKLVAPTYQSSTDYNVASSVGQEARIALRFRALFTIRVDPRYIFSEFLRLSSCSDLLNCP